MINHYLDIVHEQLTAISNAGLDRECESISIGALGSAEELKKLEELASKFYKVKIVSHHENVLIYEFHTLKVLKKECDESPEKFYALYIHSKGVTFPPEREGHPIDEFWRHYMNDWMIFKYPKWYKALNMQSIGYDIAGVRIIPARGSASTRTHASGNFWAANSEYIRSLKPIEALDQSDKFEAEMWAFSGQPVIYMPCNLFTDGFVEGVNYYEFMRNFKDLHEYTI